MATNIQDKTLQAQMEFDEIVKDSLPQKAKKLEKYKSSGFKLKYKNSAFPFKTNDEEIGSTIVQPKYRSRSV